MRYLPLHVDLSDRVVLVVGGGTIARRKIELLLKTPVQIELVATQIDDALLLLLDDHHCLEQEYRAACVRADHAFVIAATNDDSVNAQVSEDARRLNVPVNVVDAPDLSTVIFPAIIDRDPVVVSVGSSATSPIITRHIRQLVEQILPAGIAKLATYLGERRDKLKTAFPDIEQRRRVTEQFLESPGLRAAESGNDQEADQHLFSAEPQVSTGEVYIVGAGPGNPDLLTLRALQLMNRASIVLYDNLVSPDVLDRVRRDATREFVGKRSGYQSTGQEDINDLLVRLASEGQRVLRLKGGDPFIFGRGGEEISALIANQIPFEVVPGITAASGCAAYAGIPLTHRDLSHGVRFVTGHPRDGQVDLPWQEMTHEKETIVFYMGLGGLSTICQQLVNHGRPPDTPVAVISKGTTPDQLVLRGTLETMPGLVARTQIQSPTLTIVGSVVDFAQSVTGKKSS